jgi:hypothetical protein
MQLASLTSRPVERRLIRRLSTDAFIVAALALVAMRALDVVPWNHPTLDLHTYWSTRDGLDYTGANPFLIGAYLYAPAFAQVISPLTALPWPVFSAIWTGLILAAYLWLVGPWALPLVLAIPIALEIYLGQIDILLAAAIVIGFRYPAAWAFPLLTKVSPGIGLIWFAVRREWGSLLVALAATAAVAAISNMIDPASWRGWLDLLVRSATERHTIEGTYVAVNIWLRVPVAVALIVWGARTNRRWTVPVGVLLSMPVLWVNVLTILVAIIPLQEGVAPAPARRWLLSQRSLRQPQPEAQRVEP